MGTHSKDAHTRSIMKAVSYRLLAAIATGLIAYVFTRRLDISLGIASVEVVAKIICYYIHERIWSFVKFGQKEHPLSSLPVNRHLEEEDMEKKKYGIINTHGMKKDRLYKMDKLLSKKNMVKVAAVDFQVGEGSQTGNGLPVGWEATLDQFAGRI